MGLSQSDLARSVWGTVEDARGYTVAKSRDRVSAYEKGKSAPTRENLEALARVLGLAVDQLAPDLVAERAHADTSPVYRLTALEGQPNIARLQVDMVVSMAAAAQVMVLLSEQSHKHGTAP
jgi:transcriptional regulator with XRE-family HTH domain